MVLFNISMHSSLLQTILDIVNQVFRGGSEEKRFSESSKIDGNKLRHLLSNLLWSWNKPGLPKNYRAFIYQNVIFFNIIPISKNLNHIKLHICTYFSDIIQYCAFRVKRFLVKIMQTLYDKTKNL